MLQVISLEQLLEDSMEREKYSSISGRISYLLLGEFSCSPV
jgi:hypothetical protein